MSKVAIQGNASGTGTFTIAAPNSNTDRTLTLPDEAGTILTTSSDVLTSTTRTPFIHWRNSTNTAIDANFTLVDFTINDSYGIASPSSGVFTITETGTYIIGFSMMAYDATSSERQFGAIIRVNGSTVAQARDQVGYIDGATSYGNAYAFYTGYLTSGDEIDFLAERSYSQGSSWIHATSHGSIVKVGG